MTRYNFQIPGEASRAGKIGHANGKAHKLSGAEAKAAGEKSWAARVSTVMRTPTEAHRKAVLRMRGVYADNVPFGVLITTAEAEVILVAEMQARGKAGGLASAKARKLAVGP